MAALFITDVCLKRNDNLIYINLPTFTLLMKELSKILPIYPNIHVSALNCELGSSLENALNFIGSINKNCNTLHIFWLV